ncbi:MAG TPA: hemerythrin domain-containing protein [Pirellulales bacterium]|nr:hemerythrin domain-containing protein [Pirellulales bacterium]
MPPVFVNFGTPRESSFAQPLGLLSDCHRRIESFLTDMRCVATELGGGILAKADRERLSRAVRYFTVAAPRHTADEEESLFPRLRVATDPQARQAIDALSRLEADHDRADDCHAEANALADRWLAEGTLDGSDAERLVELLETLAAIYAAHIAVEDSTVFPAAGEALDSSQIEAIGREMAARRGVNFDHVVGLR